MTAAVERLKKAYIYAEKVAIWGDFDADGLTTTSVLWDGLQLIIVGWALPTIYVLDIL